MNSSRIAGFYNLPAESRRALVRAFAGLSDGHPGEVALQQGVAPELLDQFVENVLGGFMLPLGVAVNFVVDGVDVLVPMAVEESSVIAAASNMARLVRATGGFVTEVVDDRMIGQIQLTDLRDHAAADRAVAAIEAASVDLLAAANAHDGKLVALGGGARAIETRVFPPEDTGAAWDVVVHVLVDTRDAMGANTVNTMCETLAPRLAELTGARIGLRILSNLADRRVFRATAAVPAADLTMGNTPGVDVADRIVSAARFAEYDPYRAATHNKGIMNGVDPVVIATGNDWRAVEAGAHAYAARSGRYRSLSRWWRADGALHGALEIPLQLGTVGGVTRLHPVAAWSLDVLGTRNAQRLARIVAAVGLAQNLAALRALATEGIQRGHMRLHQKNLDLAKKAGA